MDTGLYDGSSLLKEAAKKHGINLSVLVAETSLWANPEVHRQLLKDNKNGAFYPNVRRAKKGEGIETLVGGVRLDGNTYANYAIKYAIGIPPKSEGKIIGFETCHIWPLTCYDEKYHTAIPNLVLLPAPLASLTDHDSEIQAILQYRSFELYKWIPNGKQRPQKPENYPTCWRRPFEFTEKIEKSIRNSRNRRL